MNYRLSFYICGLTSRLKISNPHAAPMSGLPGQGGEACFRAAKDWVSQAPSNPVSTEASSLLKHMSNNM